MTKANPWPGRQGEPCEFDCLYCSNRCTRFVPNHAIHLCEDHRD